MEEYQALLAQVPDPLQQLSAEFDELVAGMQKPKAKAAGRALFRASPVALGRAAVADAWKRG